MTNLFDLIPASFFNLLGSGSNQRVYSDCILLIYEQYEREISYRIPRGRIRDSLAIYFLENHIRLEGEEFSGDGSAGGMVSTLIRKFTSREIGWLEEETDDATYEKQIIMTENGILQYPPQCESAVEGAQEAVHFYSQDHRADGTGADA